jgi:hypothetical protein
MPERDCHGSGEVQHVDRAAPPHLAVDELARERITRPALHVDRNDVRMTHQAEPRRGRVGALDARDDRLTGRIVGGRVALHREPAAPR